MTRNQNKEEIKTRREIYESKGPNSNTAKLELCQSLHIYSISSMIIECAHREPITEFSNLPPSGQLEYDFIKDFESRLPNCDYDFNLN